jgi:hypothetical protein
MNQKGPRQPIQLAKIEKMKIQKSSTKILSTITRCPYTLQSKTMFIIFRYTDSDNSEDEGMEEYKVGGYHPVHVG